MATKNDLTRLIPKRDPKETLPNLFTDEVRERMLKARDESFVMLARTILDRSVGMHSAWADITTLAREMFPGLVAVEVRWPESRQDAPKVTVTISFCGKNKTLRV